MPVELEDIKRSSVVMIGSKEVERMRRSLNSAYSEVPAQVGEVFEAALDQVADQQIRVAQALTELMSAGSLPEAEAAIGEAIGEAQRAARGYADYESSQAKTVYGKLTKIPTNTTELVDRKRKLDEKFGRGVQLHEDNKITALEPLLEVSAEYSAWCSDAEVLITGSEGIVKSDQRRARLQILAIAVAIALGVLSLILNVILFNLRK